MGTPHSLVFGAASQQRGAPNTGRRSSGHLTPRTDLGYDLPYIGFGHLQNSAGRRHSFAPSVRIYTFSKG